MTEISITFINPYLCTDYRFPSSNNSDFWLQTLKHSHQQTPATKLPFLMISTSTTDWLLYLAESSITGWETEALVVINKLCPLVNLTVRLLNCPGQPHSPLLFSHFGRLQRRHPIISALPISLLFAISLALWFATCLSRQKFFPPCLPQIPHFLSVQLIWFPLMFPTMLFLLS